MRGIINLSVLTRKMSVNQELRLRPSTQKARKNYLKFVTDILPSGTTQDQQVEAFRLFVAAVFSADTATENACIDCLQDAGMTERAAKTRLADTREVVKYWGEEYVAEFKAVMRRFHFM